MEYMNAWNPQKIRYQMDDGWKNASRKETKEDDDVDCDVVCRMIISPTCGNKNGKAGVNYYLTT